MAAPVKPPGTPAPAPTTPSSPQTAPAKPPADVSPGTVVLIKDFTSPFRRIQQTERMDDAFHPFSSTNYARALRRLG